MLPMEICRRELCSIKISAMLSRCRGMDCYDVMFLLPQTKPDRTFPTARCSVHDWLELRVAIDTSLQRN
jgi:hypothetical protein